MVGQAAADEHRGRQLVDLRQLAERVEHDDVGARIGVDRQIGSPCVTNPSSRASRSTSPNRSGWRGARISSAPGASVLMRANARSTAASSVFIVLPATITTPARRHAEESQARARAACRATTGVGTCSESNFRLPVTVTRAGSAPRSISRRADFVALHAEAIDVCEHAAEERPDQLVARIRTRGNAPVDDDRLARRARGRSRSRFGQISVSIMTNTRGFTMLSVRRTMKAQSNGK